MSACKFNTVLTCFPINILVSFAQIKYAGRCSAHIAVARHPSQNARTEICPAVDGVRDTKLREYILILISMRALCLSHTLFHFPWKRNSLVDSKPPIITYFYSYCFIGDLTILLPQQQQHCRRQQQRLLIILLIKC